MLATASVYINGEAVGVDDASATGFIAIVFGLIAMFLLPLIIIGIILIIANWKLYAKIGLPGWYSIIPIFSLWTLYEKLNIKPYFSLVAFIPFIGGLIALIITIFAMIRLARGFGKSDSYAIGILILAFIFVPMLAFGKSTWNQKAATAPDSFPDFINNTNSSTASSTKSEPKDDK